MFSGIVIRGDGIGKGLGYPTANMDVAPDETGLENGVYAAWGAIAGMRYPAALLVDRKTKKTEVHLLDYAGDECYGELLTVQPLTRVSGIETLEGDALKAKIANDISLCLAVLSKKLGA